MAEPRIVKGVQGLKELVGEHIGYSDWHQVTQDQVNLFADATGDHQWIHVDPDRAKAGPFGGPIAHGYLTLSLVPFFLPTILQVDGISMGVNYGREQVRFPSPVPVGSKVRCGAAIEAVDYGRRAVQATITVTMKVEGAPKPSCVAQ